MSQFILFSTETSNGQSAVTIPPQGGGFYIAKATGNFDGASLALQVDMGDGDYADLNDAVFTEANARKIEIKPGMNMKAVISGAGGSTSITLKILT